MEATVVQRVGTAPKHSEKPTEVIPFRWSRWVDGDGKLWIVVGHWSGNEKGQTVKRVELLDVDGEYTITPLRAEVQEWIRLGTLKKIENPILL